MQNLPTNTLLQGGKYKIEQVLGQGGFGITYLATQVGLNRKVAIKEFFMREYCNRDTDTSHVTVGSEGSKDVVEKFRSKFVKEAQNIACLKHPHIISIHDVFEENGTAYYVMEYLDRGSLAELVKQRGRLSEADALRYIRQIADALRYIHARNMNHLDVKPGNILIDEADGAVLIDFGLSKRYDDEGNQTSTTPVGISHGYAPLEQYKKGGVGTFSPSTDIYSLGATLYKLITGDTPPDANDILTEGFPPHPAMMSDSVYNAIVQAMLPNKNLRPQSVDVFLGILDIKEDEVTMVMSPSISSRGGRTPNIAEEGIVDKQTKENSPALSPLQGGVPAGGGGLMGTNEKQRSEMERRGYEKKQTKKWLWPLLICLVAIVAFFGVRAYNNLSAENARLAEEARLAAIEQHRLDSIAKAKETARLEQLRKDSIEAVAKNLPKLYVTTTPIGVSVSVDGQKIGTTPIEGKEISRGSHEVKLSKVGYQDKTFTRTFGDKPIIINETMVETPKLQPRTQTISSATFGKKKTYIVNGVSFTMVEVSGGTFTMGSPDRTEHQVTLSSYSIGETEVTQALWLAVMGDNPSHFIGDLQRPVENVSWDYCQTFIRKLNSLTGATFRLPTEAEWEYAARGGRHSHGYMYSGSNNIASVAWYYDNSSGSTHPVKCKAPNELGIYDMSGNVYENCADWYEKYSSSPQINPKGPSSGLNRIFRGGCYRDYASKEWHRDCRVYNREYGATHSASEAVGLRLAQ